MSLRAPGRATPVLDALRARRARADEDPVVLPAGVHVLADLPYGALPAQRLDVYLPPDARAAPLLLLVHGGGWQRGDKAMPRLLRHKLRHWCGRGWIVVSTNHRLLPEAAVPAQVQDLAHALAFVQSAAPGWGGDAGRLVLIGHSAGAHLAALLTADPALARAAGAAPWCATVVLDTAALDVVAVMERPHHAFYDPVFGRDPAFWRATSPQHRLAGAPAAPMLLVYGAARDDAAQAARGLADKVRLLGGRAELLPVALGHAQINSELGADGAYTVAVDAFMASCLAGESGAPS